MSEYQCYEFVALDRPLTSKEMVELRAISTRAEISPTRFWNEYHWGDLKADPAKLLARYFDAHLYFANWSSRRFMMRLPASRIDLPCLKSYFPGGPAKLTKTLAISSLTSGAKPRKSRADSAAGGAPPGGSVSRVRGVAARGSRRRNRCSDPGASRTGRLTQAERFPRGDDRVPVHRS